MLSLRTVVFNILFIPPKQNIISVWAKGSIAPPYVI